MNRDWFDSEEFERRFHCDVPLGAACGENGTLFRLWAPTAERVELSLYASGHRGEARRRLALSRGERGLWQCACPENLDGVYYDYDVTVDGVTRRTADPYARACGLNGARSMVIDLTRTNPPGWEADRPPERQAEDIICEIHVKDFSWDAACGVPEAYRGKFKALTLRDTSLFGRGRFPTGLAHLRHLGVTHVELMPVYDYGSVDEAGDPAQFNWGYDPVNYNVPEGSYATDPCHGEVRIREMKEAVQAMHQSGLRVIMDVVYNHTYRLESPLFCAVPWYYCRQKADGSASNGSGCGTELATERSMCARYVLDSVLYWAEEYHIDGFRFDLMGLIDVPLMNRIRKALDSRFGAGEKLIFGEPWTGGESGARPGTLLCDKEHLKALNPQIGAFCDMTRDAVKGGLSDVRAAGFANGGHVDAQTLAHCVSGWAGPQFPYAAPSQTISYLSAHDDWTLWDKLVCTVGDGRHYVPLSPEVLRANRLAAAILFCCQGRLFLLSGEEFARTKRGVRNSYRSPLRINQLDWRRAFRCRALIDYYRGLIALRKRLPGLCDKSPQAPSRIRAVREEPQGAAILLDNTGGESPYAALMLIINAGREPAQTALPEGAWDVLADGESSFLWQAPRAIRGMAPLPPVSAMILGQR